MREEEDGEHSSLSSNPIRIVYVRIVSRLFSCAVDFTHAMVGFREKILVVSVLIRFELFWFFLELSFLCVFV